MGTTTARGDYKPGRRPSVAGTRADHADPTTPGGRGCGSTPWDSLSKTLRKIQLRWRRMALCRQTNGALLTQDGRLVPFLTTAIAVSTGRDPQSRCKNSYSPKQDVELGQQAAAEIRQQMPMLNDERVEDFAERIGDRLIDVIPAEYRQPEFRYSFDVVNLREINAFALPGGPMFLHRGMIAAAKSEAEVAGVMAHEIAHVVLRHGTAQATKGQKFQPARCRQVLGRVSGGVLAQSSRRAAAGPALLPQIRRVEREANLSARSHGSAGYDSGRWPAFETSRSRGEAAARVLRSHPNPGPRPAINREAAMLKVEGNLLRGRNPVGSCPLEPDAAAPTRRRPRAGKPAIRPERDTTAPRPQRPRRHHRRVEYVSAGDFRASVCRRTGNRSASATPCLCSDGGYEAPERQSAFTHGIESASRGNGQRQHCSSNEH